MAAELRARMAEVADAVRITEIYNQGIEDRVATFETDLRTVETVRSWFSAGYPIVVVERDGDVIAWANASQYRPRACYAGNCEFSVYVDRAARGTGAGRLAMNALIAAASEAGFTKLLSRVFVENMASRRMLASVGFREVGVYHRHGQLEGLWRDVVIVERLLENPGNWIAIHSGQRVTVRKTHWNNDGDLWEYSAIVVGSSQDGWIAVEAMWTRPDADVEGLLFPQGGKIIEYFSTTERFNVFQVITPTGEFAGIYANVTAPTELTLEDNGEPVLCWEDHWLDVIKLPDGTIKVLDEDEFAQSGIEKNDPSLAAKIVAAKDELLRQIESGTWDV